jgi:hypothetical protein
VLMSLAAHGQNTTVTLSVPAKPAPYVPNSVASHSLRRLGASRPAASNAATQATGSVPLLPAPGFYATELDNPDHGQVVVSAQIHPIYVNKPPAHFGNVAGFLTDIGSSDFIHRIDQYVGSTANNRYTLGTSFQTSYPIPANHLLTLDDAINIAHAAALATGGGYGHIYQVFLPSGVDYCLGPGDCYSPDDPASFLECAVNASVTIADPVGHMVFEMIGYSDVLGCAVPPTGTANNQLIDSTNVSLTFALLLTITDPDGDGWWVHPFTIARRDTIDLLCSRAIAIGGAYYYYYGIVMLNNHPYTIPPAYSNLSHGCTYGPGENP